MRAPSIRRRGRLAFDMTPMIDVTFLLIIFFLLAGQLTRQQSQVKLDLPLASKSERPQEETSRLVIVNITPAGEVLLGGEVVTPVEFRAKIQVERQKAKGDLQVRFRADRAVPYKVVEPLLVACAQSGIWDVSFVVLKRRGEE